MNLQTLHAKHSRGGRPASMQTMKSESSQQPPRMLRDPGGSGRRGSGACTEDESSVPRPRGHPGSGDQHFHCARTRLALTNSHSMLKCRASRFPSLSRCQRKPGSTRPRDKSTARHWILLAEFEDGPKIPLWPSCLHDPRACEQDGCTLGKVMLWHSQL